MIFVRLRLPSCVKISGLLFFIAYTLMHKACESVLVSLTDIYWEPIMCRDGGGRAPVQRHEAILIGDSDK